jgi:hypothetical protein
MKPQEFAVYLVAWLWVTSLLAGVPDFVIVNQPISVLVEFFWAKGHRP